MSSFHEFVFAKKKLTRNDSPFQFLAYYLIALSHQGIMLPPNNAFWSLTMGDAQNHFVPNPINRYSVSDRSGLVPNADGSVDIDIQTTASAGHESNWLPAPSDKFILWLRVYVPGAAMLDSEYKVPPVVEVK